MAKHIGWEQVYHRGVSGSYKLVTSSTGPTFDWRVANFQEMTLTGNVTCVHFNAPKRAAKLDLLLRQDATGGRTVSNWPACVLWLGRTAPTIGACPGYADLIRLNYNGVNYFGAIDHDAGPSE